MKFFPMRDGMRVAYQEWGTKTAGTGKQILALHGWLDNSNSFKNLAPHLASLGYHCVAIDHIGHGKSSHPSSDTVYASIAGVAYVNEVVESLGWEKPNILGHSMGATMSMLYAGCFPEKVNKLMLIEGISPVTQPASGAAKFLRRSLEAQQRHDLKAASTPGGKANMSKIYPTFADAVNARIRNVSTYPGKQTLSLEAARLLVGRYGLVRLVFRKFAVLRECLFS
jgi:pimeloyl-ACP methyl ester carboxylesterase